MDDPADPLDEIEDHFLADSPIPIELAARFLCALDTTGLYAVRAILSRYLPTEPKE